MSHYSKNAYLIERKNNVLMAIAEVSCSLALIVLRMKKDQNGVFNTNCLSSNSASGGIQLPPLRRASTSGKIRLPPINYVSACGKIQLPPTNSLNIITGVALLGLKLGDLQYLIDELCTIASLLGELSVPTPYLISKVDAPTNSNSMPTNSNSVIRMSEPLIIIPNNSGIELPEFEDVTNPYGKSENGSAFGRMNFRKKKAWKRRRTLASVVEDITVEINTDVKMRNNYGNHL